jgi:hypothetical protein
MVAENAEDQLMLVVMMLSSAVDREDSYASLASSSSGTSVRLISALSLMYSAIPSVPSLVRFVVCSLWSLTMMSYQQRRVEAVNSKLVRNITPPTPVT